MPATGWAASVIYVDPGGTCAGNAPCFTAIQTAVNSATPSTEIRVFPGVYAESVDLSLMGSAVASMPGDLALISVDAMGVPDAGSASIAPPSGQAITTGAGVTFEASLTVDGFNITAPDDGIEVFMAGGTLTIHSVTAAGVSAGIVAVVLSGEVRVSDFTATLASREGILLNLSNSSFTARGVTASQVSGDAVFANVLDGDLHVSDLTATDVGGSGVLAIVTGLTTPRVISVSQVMATDLGGVGVLAIGVSAEIQVADCIVDTSGGSGVFVQPIFADARIEGVTTNSTGSDGLFALAISGSVEASQITIDQAGGFGVFAQCIPGAVTMQDVSIEDTGAGAFLFVQGGDLILQGVEVANAGSTGIQAFDFSIGDPRRVDISDVTVRNVSSEGLLLIATDPLEVNFTNIDVSHASRGILASVVSGEVTLENLSVSTVSPEAGIFLDVTLADLTIDGATVIGAANSNGLSADVMSGEVSISNTTVVGASLEGILINVDAGNLSLTDVTVSETGGDGIRADVVTGEVMATRLAVNRVSDEAIHINVDNGDITVTNSTARSAENDGFDLDTDVLGNITVMNVSAEDLDSDGMELDVEVGNLTVTGFFVSGAETDGINADMVTGEVTISDGVIGSGYGNTVADGIELDQTGAGDATIERIWVNDTTAEGIEADIDNGTLTIRDITATMTQNEGIDASIDDNSPLLLIENCTLVPMADDGILVDIDNSSEDLIIRNVTVDIMGFTGEEAIDVDYNGDSTGRVLLENLTLRPVSGEGISLSVTGSPGPMGDRRIEEFTVRDTSVIGGLDDGIRISDNIGNQIEAADIHNVSLVGTGSSPELHAAIEVNASRFDLDIDRVSIVNSGGNGIRVRSNPASPTAVGIHRSVVLGGAGGGIILSSVGNLPSTEVNGNVICDNALFGLSLTGTPISLDASGNWWGEGGPTHPSNGTGTGDIVSDETSGFDDVDFTPFIESPTTLATGPGTPTPGLPTTISYAFADAGATIGLPLGPGDIPRVTAGVVTPTFTVSTTNGTISTEFARGLSAGALINGPMGDLTVGWRPSSEGMAAVTLSGPCSLDLTIMVAVGPPPDVSVAPSMLDFGARDIAGGPSTAMSVSIENLGAGPFAFTGPGVAITGPAAAVYSFAAPPDTSLVPPGGMRVVNLVFDPAIVGSANASLEITTTDLAEPLVIVGLTGRGSDGEPGPTGKGTVELVRALLGMTVPLPPLNCLDVNTDGIFDAADVVENVNFINATP